MLGDLEGVLLGGDPGSFNTKLKSPALEGVLLRDISSSTGCVRSTFARVRVACAAILRVFNCLLAIPPRDFLVGFSDAEFSFKCCSLSRYRLRSSSIRC